LQRDEERADGGSGLVRVDLLQLADNPVALCIECASAVKQCLLRLLIGIGQVGFLHIAKIDQFLDLADGVDEAIHVAPMLLVGAHCVGKGLCILGSDDYSYLYSDSYLRTPGYLLDGKLYNLPIATGGGMYMFYNKDAEVWVISVSSGSSAAGCSAGVSSALVSVFASAASAAGVSVVLGAASFAAQAAKDSSMASARSMQRIFCIFFISGSPFHLFGAFGSFCYDCKAVHP